jgi:hypothetical protein
MVAALGRRARLNKLLKKSGFVSGHDFSRAAQTRSDEGFRVCVITLLQSRRDV